jgi:hypothetical protein
MDEIILKIKQLKSIEPDKNWVKNTKLFVLSQGETVQSSFFTFEWINSRVLLVVPALLLIVAVGTFFYNRNILYPEIASVDVEMLEKISIGLRAVESDIVKTTANLEKIDGPEKALEVQEMVNSALENGDMVVSFTKEMVERPKPLNKPQVFTAINEVEYAADNLKYALDDMEETYLNKQKELARNLIEDLESRDLTEQQSLLLEQAKNSYNLGMFDKALMSALEASKSR